MNITNKEKPSVDIILPNYNKADSLKESINSIIAQTYAKWKLFIVDDNSKDDSKKIINEYKNPNIRKIFLNKNMGVSFCRNLGLRLSSSKYIAFIDSDDYWSENKLIDQINYMEKLNCEFTYTDYTPFIIKNNKKIFKRKIVAPDSFNYNQFVNNTSISMSSVIIKRSTIGIVKFKKFKICEDYFFKCEILKKINTAKKVNNILMFYQISKKSLQSNKLRNFYWVWFINKNYNKMPLFKNLKSLILISINSIKKYGLK